MRHLLGWLCVGALVCSSATAADRAAPGDSRDRNGVTAMLKRLDKAMADRDAAGALENFSDQGVMLAAPQVIHPDGAMFITKKDLQKMVAGSIAGGDRGTGTRFVDVTYLPSWPADMAYMIVTRARLRPDLRGTVDRHIITAHHEGGRWRICALFPCFMTLRVVADKVEAGGLAAAAGLKAGDIALRYGGRPVRHGEFDELAEQVAQDPRFAAGSVPVEIRRGKDRLVIKVPIDNSGVEVITRAEGDVDTVTLTGRPAGQHPAAKVVADYYAALTRGSAEGVAAAYCPGGFALFCPVKGDWSEMTIIHRGNAEALVPTFVQAVAKAFKPNTIKMGSVDLIVRGNAAVLGCRVTGQLAAGSAPTDAYDMWLMIKYKGKWGIVGFVPPMKVRLGLDR